MARPPEIDARIVRRLRNQSPPMPVGQIARVLGVSESGVYAALRRGRGTLSRVAILAEALECMLSAHGCGGCLACNQARAAKG